MAIANIINNAKKMNAEQYGKKGSKKDKEVEDLPETTIAVTLDPVDGEDPQDVVDVSKEGDAPEGDANPADQEIPKVDAVAESPAEEAKETENEKALMEALMVEREKNKALEDQFAKWKEAAEPLSEDTLNHQDAMMRELHGDDYGTALDHFHELMQGDTDGAELEALKGAPYPAIHAYKKGKERMTAKQAEAEAAKQAEREQMRQEILAELEAKRAAEAPVVKEVKKEEKPPKMMPAPAPTLPQGYAKSNEPEKKPDNIFSIVTAAKAKRKGA